MTDGPIVLTDYVRFAETVGAKQVRPNHDCFRNASLCGEECPIFATSRRSLSSPLQRCGESFREKSQAFWMGVSTVVDSAGAGRAVCLVILRMPSVPRQRPRKPRMVASQTETFVVSDIGTCLLLKLCGFVEAQRAVIRDVSENHLRLRLGSHWIEQLLGAKASGHPLDLEILFAPLESIDDSRRQARVQIVVRDALYYSRPERFEAAAKRILWHFRSHLMVHSAAG